MDDVPQRSMTPDEIKDLLLARTEPRRFGPHFGELVEAIDWELQAQLALGAIGEVEPTGDQRRRLALSIADEVDWRFQLEPRVPPGQDRGRATE